MPSTSKSTSFFWGRSAKAEVDIVGWGGDDGRSRGLSRLFGRDQFSKHVLDHVCPNSRLDRLFGHVSPPIVERQYSNNRARIPCYAQFRGRAEAAIDNTWTVPSIKR